MDQESRSGLARWFCLEVSHEIVVKVSPGPQSSKGCKICFQGGLLMALQVSGGCWQEASVPPHVDLSIALLECPHNMATSDPRESKAKTVISLMTQSWKSHFPNLLLITQVIPIPCRRGLHKGVNKGSPLEAGYHWDFAVIFSNWCILFPHIPVAHGLLFFSSFKSLLKCHFI